MRKMFLATIVALVLCSAPTSWASDFRNATWGMSRDECFDSETARNCISIDEYNKQLYRATIFNTDANIIYKFNEDKLERGAVALFAKDMQHAKEIFKDIHSTLIKRHSDFKEVAQDMHEFRSHRTITTLVITGSKHGLLVITEYVSTSADTTVEQEAAQKRKKDAEAF